MIKKNGFINIKLFKIDDPPGFVEYICSQQHDKVMCVRTFSQGSLIPKYNETKGSAGIEMNIKRYNQSHCEINLFRYVYFSQGNVAAIASTKFWVIT